MHGKMSVAGPAQSGPSAGGSRSLSLGSGAGGRRHRGAPFIPREGEPAAQRCLVRPSLSGDTHCVQPCQMCGLSRALVEGRDPGREGRGWTLCLGHNEVCINERRQEIERLNWTLASPTALWPPATFLFSFLMHLGGNQPGRAWRKRASCSGHARGVRPEQPTAAGTARASPAAHHPVVGAGAPGHRSLAPNECGAAAQPWPPVGPPFPLSLSNLY